MKRGVISRAEVTTLLQGVFVLVGLYLTSLYSYLLFHSLAEVFSVVIACSIFVLAWNSRRFLDNDYLLLVGIAYLFVGCMDLIHTLAFKGMGVFQGYDANLPTQLWIVARYLESLSLVIAPLFLRRKLRANSALLGYTLVVILLLASILGRIFPDCYIEGVGLTPFKKVSEYIIALVLLASAVMLLRNRRDFDRDVLRWLIWAIVVTIGSELVFTFYTDVYDLANLMGHFFKIVSFYLIYKAIVETGLSRPYDLLFRSLRQNEEALRRSEEEHRKQNEFLTRVLESLTHPFYVIDVHDYTVQIANSAARLDNLSEHPTCYALAHGQRRPCTTADHLCPLEEVKRTKKPVTVEHLHYDQDGNSKHVEVHGYPLFDREGHVVQVIEYALDITERKQIEESLRASEERWRSVLENAPDHVLLLDKDLNIQFVNFASPGLTIEELIGTPLYIYVSQERQSEIKEVLENVLKTAEPARYETEYSTPDGGTVYYESRVVPRMLDEQVIGLAVNARDITERKRAEEERQSLARFPSENRNPVLRVSQDGTLRYANEASAPLLAMWSSQVGQKLPGTWRQLVADAIDSDKGFATEAVCGERIFSLDIAPVEGAGYANIYGRDITKQVQASEALQKSEALLRETQRMAQVGGWELDLETQQVVWTEEVYHIHEVPPDFETNLENALSFYAPEYRPLLVQAIQRAAETGEPWDLELEFITATGRRLWVRAIGKVERQDGKAVRLSGTFQDVTERKLAEQALREAKEAAEKARTDEGERRREAERRRQIAESLGDVMAALNSNQPLDKVLDFIAAQARQLLGSQAVIICSLQDEPETFDIRAAQGLSVDCVSGAEELPGYGTLRQVVASRKPVVVADVTAARSGHGERALDAEQSTSVVIWNEHCRALLAVPIVVKDQVYGGILLYFAQPRAFSDEEVEVATVFGDQVALAIENAQLRDRVERAAVAAERSRLARDLHDSVTQALFSASLVAEVLPQVWRRDPHEAQQGLDELRHLTRGALAEMRTLLLELRPAALMETRLDDLLRQLTEAITGRAQLLVRPDIEAVPALPPEAHVAFYRVSQEALHNVIKHAEARQVTINLCASPPFSPELADDWRGQVRLRVSDDGQGFDPNLTGTDHLGLGIMRERAEAIGATLTIESQPGQGTQVTLVWQNS
jgi:PAS domain S-box-containing protein